METLINKELSKMKYIFLEISFKINNLQSKLSQQKYHNVEFQSD